MGQRNRNTKTAPLPLHSRSSASSDDEIVFGLNDPYDFSLVQRSTADTSINYVQSRSSTRDKKDRRKSKRRSSKRLGSTKSFDMSKLQASDPTLGFLTDNNKSTGNMDVDMKDHSAPDLLGGDSPGRRASMNSGGSSNGSLNRAGVNPVLMDNSSFQNNHKSYSGPSFYDKVSAGNQNVFEYASSKYVRPPAPAEEEQDALLMSSGADPNDPLAGHEAFQDEFEDEMDEIEMNEKRNNFVNLSDLEASNGRKRRRLGRGMTRFCILLVIIGAVVGATLYITTFSKSKDKTPQAVPEANKLLKLWCAEELDLGPGQSAVFPLQAPEDCKKGCNPADCCWNPKSQYECTPETVEFCEAYKKPCEIMLNPPLEDAPLPTAPSFLADVCTAEKVQDLQDAIPCQDACKAAECCWKDGSCLKTQADKCEGYVTCAVLAKVEQEFEDAARVVVPTAPPTLKTACVPEGPDFKATNVCHGICARAECCWSTTSTTQCTADSEQANCAPYMEFCSFFNQHPDIHDVDLPFPPAPSELATFCAADNIDQNGATECQEACNVADCCWKVGTVNCASNVPNHMCQDYTNHCAILNTVNNKPSSSGGTSGTNANPGTQPSNNNNNGPFPAAPEGLNVYCDPAEMEEISLHICQDKCEPAACCWSTSAEACDASVSEDLCRPYVQDCAILNDLLSYPGNEDTKTQPPATDSSSVPTAPSDFGTRCARENIMGASNGGDILIECERDCLAASCCWQPGVESCSSNSRCAAYADKCSIFTGLFQDTSGSGSNSGTSSGSSGSPGSTSTNVNVPPAASDIASTCAANNLKASVQGGDFIVECERECLKAACCWKPDHSSDCTGAPECAEYMEPCATNLVAALMDLESGGHSSSVSGSGSTTSSSNTPHVHEAPADIATTCAANVLKTTVNGGESIVNCERKCLLAACCWKAGHPTDCTGAPECAAYQEPCGTNLVNALTALEGGSNPVAQQDSVAAQEIATACFDGNAIFVKANCEEKCRPGSCCFDDGSACRSSVDCNMYEPCSVLHRRNLLRH